MHLFQFKNLPEDRITSSAEYKVLQSKFSVIFNENQQLKYQLDEMRNLLQGTKTNHRKHIEQMEVRFHYFNSPSVVEQYTFLILK